MNERERVAVMAFYAAVLLLAYLVFRLFQPFLRPLGWAGVLVVFLYPLHVRLERRWGRTTAAAISTALVTVMLIAPAVLLAFAFVREAANAIDNIERGLRTTRFPALEALWVQLQETFFGERVFDLAGLVKDVVSRGAGVVASRAGGILRNVALFFFDLIVVLFATFFLFRDGDSIVNAIRRSLPFEEARRERMIAQTRDMIYAGISTGLIVAAVQGTLGGITFALLGIGAPVFWGVAMGFFSLIPFAGTWVIWGPVAVWLLVSGEVAKGLLLLGVGAGIIAMADNVLRPILVSGRAEMNGLLVFVSLLGGLSVFGLIGLVLGPLVLAVALGLFDAYTKPL